MARFDQTLIDPDPAALVRALLQATRAANGRKRTGRVEKDAAAWARLVRRSRGAAQGVRAYRGDNEWGAAVVRVAWWRDHVGRRHWRVAGDRVGLDEFVRWGRRRDGLDREPLWHLYPDVVALRETDAGRELVAACRCGAAGTPAELGWAGPSCGPCHDREEDDLPPLPAAAAGYRRTLPFAPPLAVLGPGGRLVTASPSGALWVWDGEGGEETLKGTRALVRGLAVSAAGEVAAVVRGSLLLGRLEGGPWRTLADGLRGFASLAFSPDGSRLFCMAYRRAFVVDVAGGGLTSIDAAGCANGAWLGPSALALLEISGAVAHVDLRGGRRTRLAEPPGGPVDEDDIPYHLAESLAGSTDGAWLAATRGHAVRLCRLPAGEWSELPVHQGGWGRQALSFTPDGLLAHVEGIDRNVSVADPAAGRWLGSLRFAPGPYWAAWLLSVDGQFVLRQHDRGVQVWPWRRLWGGEGPKNPAAPAGSN